jgi:hypothetical protein
MTVASVVISIVSLLVAGAGAVFAYKSVTQAKRSADAAEGSRDAANAQARSTADQADAARQQLAIERERFNKEQTPVLEGSLKLRPGWRGGPEDKDHVLEVRVRSSQTLMNLVLHLPPGAYIGRSKGLTGPSPQDFGYPEGRGTAPLGPGHPGIWDVVIGAESTGSFIATADCRDEYGKHWLAIEVPVTREY